MDDFFVLERRMRSPNARDSRDQVGDRRNLREDQRRDEPIENPPEHDGSAAATTLGEHAGDVEVDSHVAVVVGRRQPDQLNGRVDLVGSIVARDGRHRPDWDGRRRWRVLVKRC